MAEPGVVTPGRWAHVRHAGQHLIVEHGPYAEIIDPQAEALGRIGEPHAFQRATVATACGRHYEPERIWHDPPKPHCKPCGTCARSSDG